MLIPQQIITIEMERKTVRIEIEKTAHNLYRANFSYMIDDKTESFIYSGHESSDCISLLEDCVETLMDNHGKVIGGNNQTSDIYEHSEIEKILGIQVTKS